MKESSRSLRLTNASIILPAVVTRHRINRANRWRALARSTLMAHVALLAPTKVDYVLDSHPTQSDAV